MREDPSHEALRAARDPAELGESASDFTQTGHGRDIASFSPPNSASVVSKDVYPCDRMRFFLLFTPRSPPHCVPYSDNDIVMCLCAGPFPPTQKDEDVKARRDRHIEAFKEEVLMAERAVLFSLGFEINIEQPHFQLLQILGKFNLQAEEIGLRDDYVNLLQASWNLLNDR